jgi:hypothetical protein
VLGSHWDDSGVKFANSLVTDVTQVSEVQEISRLAWPPNKGLKLLCCKAQRDKASAKKEALQ